MHINILGSGLVKGQATEASFPLSSPFVCSLSLDLPLRRRFRARAVKSSPDCVLIPLPLFSFRLPSLSPSPSPSPSPVQHRTFSSVRDRSLGPCFFFHPFHSNSHVRQPPTLQRQCQDVLFVSDFWRSKISPCVQIAQPRTLVRTCADSG